MMSSLQDRPVVVIAIIVLIVGALVFGWTRYRAMTGVTKENSIRMTPDQLRDSMAR